MRRSSPTPWASGGLLAAILSVPSLASATCYWQNSTLAPQSQYSIAPNDVACFPDQENSPCCGQGWTCQSDGVCKIAQTNNGETNDYYYRGMVNRVSRKQRLDNAKKGHQERVQIQPGPRRSARNGALHKVSLYGPSCLQSRPLTVSEPDANQSWPLLKCNEASGEDWYCCVGDSNCDCGTGVD